MRRPCSIGWLIGVTCGVWLSVDAIAAQEETPQPDVESLRGQFFDAYAQNDILRAIELGLQIDAARPGDALVQYNLARLYGRSGNKEQALHWFDLASRNGFTDARAAAIDPDLQIIRGEPAYRRAMAVLQQVREQADLPPQLVERERKDPLIVLPPDYDAAKPAPLLVLLDGIAGGPEKIAADWKETAAAMSAIIVAPHTPYAFPEGTPAWGPAKDAEQTILAGLEFAKSRHKIEEGRIILGGFSQGGTTALQVAMRNPSLVEGVVVFSARYDPWLARPPVELSRASYPRVFLGVGAIDGYKSEIIQAEVDFRHAGLPTKLVVYPELGIGYPNDRDAELAKATAWVSSK